MSLQYMGVPGWCRHGGYEDRCELCKRDREIRQQKDEIERLRDQHDTYVEMVEQLTRQLDAAAVLLRHPDRVKWGYDVEKNAKAYFLNGKLAGPTIRHVIRMAANEG